MMKDISDEALYMGIAEEAAELSAAANKVARILHGENPARMTLEEAMDKVQEEYTDLLIYLNEVGITSSNDVLAKKLNRYMESKNEPSKVSEADKIIADLKQDLKLCEQELRVRKINQEYYPKIRAKNQKITILPTHTQTICIKNRKEKL